MTTSTTATTTTTNVRQLVPATRPRPIIRRATPEDLAWDPEAREQYTVVDGENVRAGSSFAVCRPGLERWPLGHVKKHYRPVSHRATAHAIRTFCAGSVTPAGALIAGHGYHVAHSYAVHHMQAGSLDGVAVHARLVLVNSNTGDESLRAAMVMYIGQDAIGSVARTSALHVSSQPERWQGDIDALIEKTIVSQDAILDLLKAAAARELTDADRAFFKRREMTIKKGAKTVLDAVRSWTRGNTEAMTWGVWERRLDDQAIRALVVLLGRDVHGAALDDAMGYTRRNPETNEVVGGVYRFVR